MKNINNIDELLKNSFGNFEAAPPPDAWNGIQQGLTHAGVGGSESAVSKTASVVKSAGIISKVALIAITSGIVIGGGYLAYKYRQVTETKNTGQPVGTQTPQISTETDNSTPDRQNVKVAENPTVSAIHNKKDIQNSSPAEQQVAMPENKTSSISAVIDNKPESVGNKQNGVNNTPKPGTAAAKTGTQPTQLPKVNHGPHNPVSNPMTNDENKFAEPEVATVFTPDGDGKNDKLDIIIANESYYDVKIYDKEMKVVFESDNKEKTWDGTRMNLGEPCDPGDYTLIFTYRYKNSEKINPLRKAIKLIR